MKTKSNHLTTILLLVFTMVLSTSLIAQVKSKKQLKQEQKLEKQKQLALVVESQEFIFVAERILPQNGVSMWLTSYYTVEFQPELINSFLPFIGRGFSGIGYGGDTGMKFEGKPTIFHVEKTTKAYQIRAEVRGQSDVYSLLATVYFDGQAYLTINSNNRSPISYDGKIEAFQKDDQKKGY